MTKKYLLFTAIFLFPFLLQGCLDASESEYERRVREADEAIEAYLTENNIEAEKQPSGVYIEVLTENEEGKKVVEDHVVGILYEMTHLEGEYLIESHKDTLNPLRFSYSQEAILPAGLNYEIGKMREDEKYRFYVPSYQAFGQYSHDELFDAYSHFIIEVDLIELKTEEEIYEIELEAIQNYVENNEPEAESYPNGLYYVMREEGDGDRPNSNSQVEFHYTRKYLDGTVVHTTTDGEPEKINLGSPNPQDPQPVPGLEDGLQLMKEGGKATLIMPSKLGFGKSVQVIPQQARDSLAEDGIVYSTQPYSSLIYEVELIDVN